MAKKKVVEETESLNWHSMASSFGAELLDDVGEVPCWIDSGSLSLNYICSGNFMRGIGGGRIIELYGDSASGKSLVAMNILKGTQKIGGVPILIDAEHAVSREFAVKASKIDPARMIVLEADTLEKGFARINNAIRKIRQEWKVPLDKPITIVYDSIAASPSEREFAETTIDLENSTKAALKEAGAGSDKPGERAKICSKELRKLPGVLKANNACVVFINQIREKIGIMYGSNEAMAGGGRALEYYASTRLKLRSNKTPKDSKGVVLGVNISATCTKNRCFRPYAEAKNLYLFFEQGINPFGGLLELLIQSDRIKGSNGNYTVCEPYADGKEIKFKASKERNDVPADVLLQCPKLVDAECEDQIRYYLNLSQEAIDIVENGIASEELNTVEENYL
jgi:recombination protein RecA